MSTCRKIRYRSEIDAMLAMTSNRRRRHERRNHYEIRSYRCPLCRGWHLTSEAMR